MTTKEFGEKYLQNRSQLYRVAFYILESKFEAEDAVQDLYIKLWKNKDKLENIQNPKAYSITLIKNICIDKIRRTKNKQEVDLSENIIANSDIENDIESKEILTKMIKAIERLPQSQRDVLQMKIIEDMSYDEISQKTGMNNLTLRSLLSQARKKIKEII